MNAIILKGAVHRQPPLPQSDPRAKTIAHPWPRVMDIQGEMRFIKTIIIIIITTTTIFYRSVVL
jgi:hypothetical protein